MTTGGEPPPPLPPGDDPFELLGVPEDANDKDIRKAYAKRIRVYRPDRAPAEFQRIHRAFERLTHGRSLVLPRPPASDEPPAATEGATPPVDAGATISAAFVEIRGAAERGDSAEIDRIIGGLLDRKVPLDQLFDDADNHDLLLRSEAITWTRLGDHDRGARWAIWNQAFDRTYADHPARSLRMLADDELRHHAADDPSVAAMVLDRLASLVWREQPVTAILESYRPYLPQHPMVDHRLDAVLLHVELHARLEGVELPPVMSNLRELIVRTTIGTHELERAAAVALRDALSADVRASLAQLEAWAKLHRNDAQPALRELLAHALAGHRLRLDAMPKRRFDALTKQLHIAGKRPWTPKISAWLLFALTSTIFAMPYGLLVPVGLLAYFLATESRRYRDEIAPGVARAILAVPVDSTVVERWIKINPKLRGRLGRFEMGVENDWGLYLFSLLVAYAAEVGRLDANLDDD